MVELTCPYCDSEFEVDPEMIYIDEAANMECENCEKYFGYTAEYYIHVSEHRADCLNGTAEHTGKIGGLCKICGEHIDPPEKDKDEEFIHDSQR